MEKNRLFWASRRGMLELDLVLMPFLENVYSFLPQADKERYWKLLDCEDQDMFNWFIHRQDPGEPDLRRIIGIIRESRGRKADGSSHGAQQPTP